MSLRFAGLTARRELRGRLTDVSVLIWIAIPIILAGLMTLVFGGENGGPEGKLLVADYDQTLVSRFVAGAFDQGPLGEIFTVENVDEQAGRERLGRGEASALLVIPDGFTEKTLRNEPVRLALVMNPAQRVLPQMVEETLDILSEAVFYLQAIVGDDVREIAAALEERREPSIDEVSQTARSLYSRFESLDRYLDPVLLELETDIPEKDPGISAFNIGELFFPGSFFMAVLFMAQGISGEVWREKQQGTLRRIASTPAPLWTYLLGRTAAYFALIALVAAVSLPLAARVMGFELHAWATPVLWVAVAGTVFFLFLTFGQLFASSARTGNLVTTMIVFPLVMLGGAFFPIEAMPAGMAAIGRLTPNGWALEVFKALLAGEASGRDVLIGLAAMSAAGTLLFMLALTSLRARFVAR